MNTFQKVTILVAFMSIYSIHFVEANTDRVVREAQKNEVENENQDAISRWSREDHDVLKPMTVKRAVPLSPISNASFQSGASRSPASAPLNEASRENNRGPAALVATVSPTENGVQAKTWARTLRKKKIYQEVAIIANDLGFFPSTIFVTQGVPVKLFVTGASVKSQCFMLDAFGVRRQIHSQKIEEVMFTPEQSGSFVFSCPMNGAKGTLLVKDFEVGRLPASVSVQKEEASDERNESEEGSSFEK